MVALTNLLLTLQSRLKALLSFRLSSWTTLKAVKAVVGSGQSLAEQIH